MQKFRLVSLLVAAVFLAATGPAAGQWNPNYGGVRTTMVHLFEWRFEDIARECEQFLGPLGYGGIQISPVNENFVISDAVHKRPWWERYQPVSYRIATRSGNEAAFQSMLDRCNNASVRVYVDALLNHMTPNTGVGTGGSTVDGAKLSYPGVPYNVSDFNSPSACLSSSGNIEDFQNPAQVRNCRLVGLPDLDQSKEPVRQKMITFLNKLIDMGVAGFRLDASKHMWPGDLTAIARALHDLPTGKGFPPNSRPLLYQEVIDLDDTEAVKPSEYWFIGRVTEFKFGALVSKAFRKSNSTTLASLKSLDGKLMPSNYALNFIDNHDNQRGAPHGGDGAILTFRDRKLYKMAVAFMLAYPHGLPRVMSSFFWELNIQNGTDVNNWMGPPHDDQYNITPPTILPDGQCSGGWVCEHRWPEIAKMTIFRNIVNGTNITNWWDNGKNQIAFGRGTKGFVVINNENVDMSATLQTSLPAGDYCDIISGSKINGACTGKTVKVASDGKAAFSIGGAEVSPFVVINSESVI